MADLRWILLLVGLAFLAALAAWESRRPRQGRRDTLSPTDRGEPAIGEMEQADASNVSSVSSSVSKPSVPMRASFNNPRVRVMVPVRVELPPLDPEDSADVEHFSVHAADVKTDERRGEPGDADELHIDGLRADRPRVDDPRVDDGQMDDGRVDVARVDEQWPVTATLATSDHTASDEALLPPLADELMVALPDSIVLPTIHARQAGGSQIEQQPVQAAVPLTPTIEPIVEWPPESQRHVISVRVVGVNSDRMSGRPLRQALSACGFVHGRFGIFHQPGVDGRALVSAANLNKPGVFDPLSMDFQRFRGLGLFAVLPGPLPPAAALDHLLDTAGDLAQRLHARLLDEQGQPLDEERLEALARTVHGMSNSMLRSEPAA